MIIVFIFWKMNRLPVSRSSFISVIVIMLLLMKIVYLSTDSNSTLETSATTTTIFGCLPWQLSRSPTLSYPPTITVCQLISMAVSLHNSIPTPILFLLVRPRPSLVTPFDSSLPQLHLQLSKVRLKLLKTITGMGAPSRVSCAGLVWFHWRS